MNTTFRKLLAFSLVAFGIFCFLKGLPSSVTRDAANGVMPGAVASVHSERPALPATANVKTRAIKDIRVGQRVLAKNPEISNLERRTRRAEPEFGRWLQLSLEMPKSDGSTLHIEMLRSEEWLRNQIGFVIGEIPDPSGERLGVSPPCTTTEESGQPKAESRGRQSEISDFKSLPCDSPKTELAPLSPLRPIFSDIAFASIAAEAEGVELVGLTVDLDLPEMGACGTAVIREISTTPEIEQGDGQVVTATFRHPPSNTVLDVVFVDEGTNRDQHGLTAAETAVDHAASVDVVTAHASQPETSSKPIGVTDNHQFWSEDRGEFIEIGRMEIGERVRTLFGETKILAQKLPRPGAPAEVYNLEVHEEHVYFVGDDCVLAHNSCDDILRNTGELDDVVTHNRQVLEQFDLNHPTGFSGAYNTRNGAFAARPSGNTVLKSGIDPPSLVNRRGGHISARNTLDDLDAAPWDETVGFSILFSRNGNGVVAWNSGGLNSRFPGDLVPDSMRGQILETLQDSLGIKLKSLGNLKPL